jgi:peptide/nickel transport system substrate-binding protein
VIEQPHKEFRLRRSDHILDYLSKFSATEKAVFGILVGIACVSALMLAIKTSESFMAQIPTVGGELREGEIGLPRTIDPILAVSDVDRDISALVYSGLTRYDQGSFVPDIASSWTISSDGLRYDFVLRPKAAFQDGTPLTADDVAFTIEKIQDPALKSPRQADWADVTVKVISPTEIEFILKQPYSGFLSNTAIGIIPKHIWGNVSDDQFIFSQYNIEPIGSGPYALASIAHDSGGIPTSYDLAIWKGYYGVRPFIKTISFHFYEDQGSALADLNNGYIDSIPSIDPSAAAALATDAAQGYTVMATPLPRVFGVFFNQSQSSVLGDPVVRQALDMATDRDAIINSVLYGYGVPDYGPIPPELIESLGITPDIASDTANILGAEALLEKNGWRKDADGIYEKKPSSPKAASTTLSFDIYTADSPDLVATANLLKDQWGKIGAAVDVQAFDSSDLYQNIIRTRKYDALLFGEQVGKDRDLYAFWHSSQRNAPGLNVALYANSKVDALLSDIRSTSSTTVALAEYAKLDHTIENDLPAIFLYSPDFIYVVPKSIHGMHIGSMTIPSDRWSSVASWYIETERVWNIFQSH